MRAAASSGQFDCLIAMPRRGVVLIPGVERTIAGRHVLVLNFPLPLGAERVRTLEGIGQLKTACPEGLVVAPHPFYPLPSCLGDRLDRYAELFDAVEHNALYSRLVNFNPPSARSGRGSPFLRCCSSVTPFAIWARSDHAASAGGPVYKPRS